VFDKYKAPVAFCRGFLMLRFEILRACCLTTFYTNSKNKTFLHVILKARQVTLTPFPSPQVERGAFDAARAF
jgi:hypothetical protein